MHRSKPRARAVATTRAPQSSSSPALPSPASPAPAAADTPGAGAPPAADTSHLIDVLDAHMDRLHGVRSVLWAMSVLLENIARTQRVPRAVGFELQQLARTGLGLASESMDALAVERCCVSPGSCH